MIKKEEQAICYIHGIYYVGYCECPICKAQKEAIKEDTLDHR